MSVSDELVAKFLAEWLVINGTSDADIDGHLAGIWDWWAPFNEARSRRYITQSKTEHHKEIRPHIQNRILHKRAYYHITQLGLNFLRVQGYERGD